MAPLQELEKLIPQSKGQRVEQYRGYSSEEVISSTENLVGDEDAHEVVIVQPDVGTRGNKDGGGKEGKKGGTGGPEEPKNCKHLETALFFFGIAGMIVSLVMLLVHLLKNLVPYY